MYSCCDDYCEYCHPELCYPDWTEFLEAGDPLVTPEDKPKIVLPSDREDSNGTR